MDRGRAPNGIGHLMILIMIIKNDDSNNNDNNNNYGTAI